MPRSNFLESLAVTDSEVFGSIQKEASRTEEGLELIASENYVSRSVLEAQGSILTNKYAEGYPKSRYYSGCCFVDEIEHVAQTRAQELFHAEASNVQPHSGSQANMAVYLSLMNPGDCLMGMSLSHGGHLTHGSAVNFSGSLFKVISYELDPETECLNYDHIRSLVRKHRPKVLLAGASAYPRIIDFERFGEIAKESGAHLVADMAHIAGLVATGFHPSPIPHATYTTSTTHKTLRGPRGGFILGSHQWMKKANTKVFPGIQGGPLMHVIAAKAVAFQEASKPEFKEYQKAILQNARVLAESLMDLGCCLVTGGTENHLLLMNLKTFHGGTLTGKDAAIWLENAGMTVNKNSVPKETRSPFLTSGIRIGTPALTTRGLRDAEMKQIAKWMYLVLSSKGEEEVLKKIRSEVLELCAMFPVYRSL